VHRITQRKLVKEITFKDINVMIAIQNLNSIDDLKNYKKFSLKSIFTEDKHSKT
jgi:hypothetical protein